MAMIDDERYPFEDDFCRSAAKITGEPYELFRAKLDECVAQGRGAYYKAMDELGRIIATAHIDRIISAVDDYRDYLNEYQRDLDQHFDTGAPAPIWKR